MRIEVTLFGVELEAANLAEGTGAASVGGGSRPTARERATYVGPMRIGLAKYPADQVPLIDTAAYLGTVRTQLAQVGWAHSLGGSTR